MVAQGLVWAWRVLSPQEPFSQGVSYDDPEITKGAGAAQRQCQVEAHLRGGQEKGIRIYPLLFEVDFEETQQIFRDCASKDASGVPVYYYIPDASEL
jgi:hypothetical protein